MLGKMPKVRLGNRFRARPKSTCYVGNVFSSTVASPPPDRRQVRCRSRDRSARIAVKRAVSWAKAGTWPADRAVDSLTLSHDDRHRRRLQLETDRGTDLLLDLAEAVALSDGDGLRLDDGGWIRMIAAAEPVIDASAATTENLLRLAWHLGNRHTPAQLFADRIRIREDHVLAEMLRGLGAQVERIEAPFSPEGGAYPVGSHRHRHEP